LTDSASYPDRQFRIWRYAVGMSRLLLRSTKTHTYPTRVDLLFQNVKALKLTKQLDGLIVRQATDQELRAIESETGLLTDAQTHVFVLTSTNHDGYVVAGVMGINEDDGDYSDPSPLWDDET
jgi:hypothetical protein